MLTLFSENRKRCKEDKDATMTLVYKKAYPGHHMRTSEQEIFVVVNDEKRILHHVRPRNDKNFKVPLEVFESDDIINLKFDLMDTGIAICSQAVPPLFADNFDCQTLDEFIKGTIQNDLTNNTLHLFELGDDCYASRIINFHTYFAAQHDVLHRWLHPIVPEMTSGKHLYSLQSCPPLCSKFQFTRNPAIYGRLFYLVIITSF